MNGTQNQIELAEQIKLSVQAEFDRVAEAFRAVAAQQDGQRRADTLTILQLVEEKRMEVMAIDKAGYFIHTWWELKDQVRQIIGQDARFRAIQATRSTYRDVLAEGV